MQEVALIMNEGEMVTLRPLRRSDMERSIKWRNDPETREMVMGYHFPVTESTEEKWYEDAMNDQTGNRVIYAIEARSDGGHVGFIYLNQIDWISRTANFGIVIGDKDRRGDGLGPEAMHLFFRYAFHGLNLRRICLQVCELNHNAISVYKRFGFKEEGVLREHVYFGGRYHDVVCMALFAQEYAEAEVG